MMWRAMSQAIEAKPRKLIEHTSTLVPPASSGVGIEDSTIRTHVKRILMKLDLRDRVQAVIFAYETGVTRPGARREGADVPVQPK